MIVSKSTYDRRGLFILTAIVLVIFLVQGQNLFRFPYYQDSEGTSISNAEAFIHEGKLSAYTYAYEDPPLGSFLLGVWSLTSGGANAFGFSINSGRVLMMALHLCSVALIYGISKKTTKGDLVAIIAAFLFAFSPLAASLQRRVLLDNIAIMWLLLSLYLVLGDERHLKHYFVSAIAFALAVLTKGSTIWFLPAFAYIITLRANAIHKRFAYGHWMAIAIFLMSLYPLYAQMKQELFPQGWLLGGDFPHVSLFERLIDRGPETGRFLNVASGLTDSAKEWVDMSNATADPVLVYGGLIAVIFVFLLAIDNKAVRPIIAVMLAFGLKILIGGPVFVSDAIAILPFLAICVAIVAGTAAKAVAVVGTAPVVRLALAGIVTAVFMYPFATFYGNRVALYTVDQVEGQISAVQWIRDNIPEDAVIVTDNYAFVDLRAEFQNAHHYWKVDTDPAVKFTILEDDVCNIDYILTSPQVVTDTQTFGMNLMQRALDGSEVLVSYPNNGWPIEIRQTSKRDCAIQIADEPAVVSETTS